jgi:phospholipid/cholesterol/gamma-HCH transport system permease protein
MAITDAVGRLAIDNFAYVGQLARLTWRAAVAVVTGPRQGAGLRYRRALHQAMAVGVEAIPIISLITFFVGVILALQSAHELKRFGAMEFVPNAVALSLTRELGPLMTAIIVIGRSGSAFAAEIGTMKVSEEIDALETMALDPVSFLVAPKLVAMLIMMPCLTMWSDFMGIAGGAVFGILGAGFTITSYFRATLDALLKEDIITGLIKAFMFGMVITAVGCQEGLMTGLGSEQVGRSTTTAVVKSIFVVILVDLGFTALFYFTSPS